MEELILGEALEGKPQRLTILTMSSPRINVHAVRRSHDKDDDEQDGKGMAEDWPFSELGLDGSRICRLRLLSVIQRRESRHIVKVFRVR